MSVNAVRVVDISKHYRIGELVRYSTLRESLTDAVGSRARRLFGRPAREPLDPEFEGERDLWALNDVSFNVPHGEVFGLIGRNGAGKSTMLKILTRITEPTKGYAEVRGRVGSLLEVGTGFHPELTGRENVFLNGAILGMSRAEIRRKFDEIVAFAEVDRFIDTPVKRYSDGMYMRLAFAVAAHLEPEILIVDEVLAVGDAAFQRKCLGKMDDVAGEGRTVLFVSHNMLAVQDLCTRVVWLEGGRVAGEGRPGPIVAQYLQTTMQAENERIWDEPGDAPGTDDVRLRSASVRATGCSSGEVTVDRPIKIAFSYWNFSEGDYIGPWIQVHNAEGVLVFEVGPRDEADWDDRVFPSGVFEATFTVPAHLLNSGVYRVTLQMYRESEVLFDVEDVLVFDLRDSIEERENYGYEEWGGVIRPRLPWTHRLIEPLETGSLLDVPASGTVGR